MGKKFIIQAAQVPLKYQIEAFPSVLKAVRSCYKPSIQQNLWNRLLAFVILPLLQNKPSIHVFRCRATKQIMEMPKKVILCISSPSRFTQLLWKILTGGLNKTSHVLSFFHQRLTKDNLFFCIPPAMPLLGKAAAEAFLGSTVIPSISGWLKWAAGVGRQIRLLCCTAGQHHLLSKPTRATRDSLQLSLGQWVSLKFSCKGN